MLYFNTVNELLKESLLVLMRASEFNDFRLVGGTALSLQCGHRLSIDIDLFSDVPYGMINFEQIDCFLEKTFLYCQHFSNLEPAMGKSYRIGMDKDNVVKLDVYYTDLFIQSPIVEQGIRMATVEEIIAMKMDVVQRVARKKDFLDLHELMLRYDITTMLSLHLQRYPYTHDRTLLLQNLINFELSDDDFDPVCLRGKYWEFIKDDIIESVINYQSL